MVHHEACLNPLPHQRGEPGCGPRPPSRRLRRTGRTAAGRGSSMPKILSVGANPHSASSLSVRHASSPNDGSPEPDPMHLGCHERRTASATSASVPIGKCTRVPFEHRRHGDKRARTAGIPRPGNLPWPHLLGTRIVRRWIHQGFSSMQYTSASVRKYMRLPSKIGLDP